MKKLITYESGFTLVEVIVVTIIFGILSTGMASMMAVLIQNNDFSRAITEASTLAENKMEEYKNMGYTSIVSDFGSDEPVPGYFRSWTVEENVPQAEMKQIVVTVGWYDRSDQWHRVKIYTAINS